MNSKIILYILIIITAFSGGYIFNSQETIYTNTVDTLNIETVVFETITIHDTVTNIITQRDSIYFDSIQVDTLFLQDTIRTVDFHLDNSWCNITGTTYHRTIGQSTFDIFATRKPLKLTLKAKWINSQFNFRLSENGTSIPFKSKIEYNQFNQYINSLKTPLYQKWYIMFPLGVLATAGTVYLVK